MLLRDGARQRTIHHHGGHKKQKSIRFFQICKFLLPTILFVDMGIEVVIVERHYLCLYEWNYSRDFPPTHVFNGVSFFQRQTHPYFLSNLYARAGGAQRLSPKKTNILLATIDVISFFPIVGSVVVCVCDNNSIGSSKRRDKGITKNSIWRSCCCPSVQDIFASGIEVAIIIVPVKLKRR